MMKIEDELVKEAHVILHPIRFRIIELLSEKPMHVSELSKTLSEERRLVSYHLDMLEDYGFVKSRHEISEQPKSKGKALRIYWTTEKVRELLGEIRKM
jgi:predicted transcriptional regulator